MESSSLVHRLYKTVFPNKPKDISGQIVIITKAGYAMGAELSFGFAKLGAIVVSVDHDPKRNIEAIERIQNIGGKAYGYECDVTDREAVFSLAEKVRKEVGVPSILVYIPDALTAKPLLECTDQNIKKVIDTNLTASIWMIQAFLPAMKEQKRGHIVATTQWPDYIGFKNMALYHGTWDAVRGVMRTLENELHQENELQHGTSNNPIKFTAISPFSSPRYQDGDWGVDPNEAADFIIDAVRRDVREATIPSSTLGYTGI